MDLSIIIVSYKSTQDIVNCVASIRGHFKDFAYEIIIVNNFSGDAALYEMAGQNPDLILLDDGENKGYGRANNAGTAIAKGKYICYMNPDIIITKNVLPLLVWMDGNPQIGMAGPLLRNSDLSIQHSCRELPSPDNWFAFVFSLNTLFPKITAWGNYSMMGFPYSGDAEVGWVSGAYMLTSRALMEEVGGFDPAFFMYCEDTDLCWKVREAGYTVMFSDRSEAIHIGGTTSVSKSEFKARALTESYEILWKKHYSESDAHRMMRQTMHSASLKAFCYGLFRALRLSDNKAEGSYNKTVASTLRRRLKDKA